MKHTKNEAHASIKSLAEDYSERIWNKKDISPIDDYFTDSTIIHSLLGDFHGPAAMKKISQTWLTGFPDMHVDNLSVLSENDLVSIQWHVKATHLGEFKGKQATGKPVSYSGVTIYRILNGKIKEYWAYIDMQHLLNQLDSR